MTIDISPATIIQAGSGLLYMLLGAALLLRRPGTSAARALGAFCLSFGVGFVLGNLFVGDAALGPPAAVGMAANFVLQFFILLRLVFVLPTSVSGERKAFLVAGAVALVYGVTLVVVWVPGWSAATTIPFGKLVGYLGVFTSVALLVLPLLCALRYGARARFGWTRPSAHALTLLSLSASLFVAASAAGDLFGTLQQANFWYGPGDALTGLLVLVGISATWLWAHSRHPSRLALTAALVPLAVAFAVMATFAALGFERAAALGLIGIARILGWLVLIGLCISHPDLGLKLPGLRSNRSAIAMGALALLFVVAQIAQNFFSAEYGLLTGGVIAGVVLFAANPIQKAVERATEKAPKAAGAGSATRKEEVYLGALRLAMRDRTFTRDEEIHLHKLAEELGIGAGRAHELMVAVEGERGNKRRAG